MCTMLQSLILTLALLLCRCLAVDDDPHPTLPGPRTPVPSLYHQRYSEQTFIGTHDSVAVRTAENRWSLSGNQYFNVSVQLQAGVRLLQAQGHRDPDGSSEIRLCHFNCALMDGGSLVDHLRTVKRFLDANPHELITLLFVNTGPALEHWAQAYFSTGLDLLSYIPPQSKRDGYMHLEDWPTIADMVSTNQRLVTFLSGGADEGRVPYLLHQWDYVFETNFGIESPEQYSCAPARPRWWDPSYIPSRLSLVNHFLYAQFLGFRYPNATYANTTNAAGFHVGELGEHAVRCQSVYQRRPNFLLLDFFSEGQAFEVEHGMNAY
ncbi:hypothetical protein LTR56_004975 [Elasticomyces elasticus]|nr:hypothetical protein LTR22_015790 [Elasticomyces elasticus]KAK3652681.1 hypothetical protein LTR56_004975 [Elasticomyces elasticus]KAK4914611.1 hypothetical protein LTR49_017178 [Elasticomyces elasticus]KAK5753977.1 hypothetical protein LTS12_015943 [Elasticomyces elasticus]